MRHGSGRSGDELQSLFLFGKKGKKSWILNWDPVTGSCRPKPSGSPFTPPA
jgi:hypothetical protein